MNVLAILQILDALLLLTARAPVVAMRIQAIRAEMEAMRAQGREPTQEEWEALGTKIDDRLARLKAKVDPFPLPLLKPSGER